MSKGAIWQWYPVIILAGIIVFVLVVTVPAWFLGNYCSQEYQAEGPASYRITVDGIERQNSAPDPVNPPITQFSLGARLPGPVTTTGSANATYYAPKEVGGWWGQFWCNVTGADYTLAVFTVVLALSTIGLWIATERAIRKAEATSERQFEQTQESLASATAQADAAQTQAAFMRKDFYVRHRPRIKVRGLKIEGLLVSLLHRQKETGHIFTPDTALQMRLFVGNDGATNALVKSSYVEGFWSLGALPFRRPYDELQSNDLSLTELRARGSKAPPTITTERISVQPATTGTFEAASGTTRTRAEIFHRYRQELWQFYLLGQITYTNESDETIYQTRFCRHYSFSNNQFSPVNDPDFEYEE